MQIAQAAQMREIDRRTIEEIGIPGMVLMENAGRATVTEMERHFGPVAQKTVCILAGPGNNGGDGLVIARTVHGLGGFPFVFFLTNPEDLRGDAAENFAIQKRLRLPYQLIEHKDKLLTLVDTVLTLNRIHPIHSLVDALFGIGLERMIKSPFAEAIESLNILGRRHHLPVVSVDIPSGLDTDTGAVLGTAVQADLTVTYGLPKPGHYHHGGPLVGRLACVDIGIPGKVVAKMALKGRVLDQDTCTLLKPRPRTAHKGTSGHLLVVAGSEGKTGAALLCGQGALRCGTGLVTFAVPHELNPIFETALFEAMSVPLPHSGRRLVEADYEQILALCGRKQAMVIGPGLGLDAGTARLVLRLYGEVPLPQVIDADACTILADHPEVLHNPAGPRIFTPHPGEMSRLLGNETETVQDDRLAAAQWQNGRADGMPAMVTVLKGAGTVVAEQGGLWAINSSGNPGMGTGGMGDVLAGVIGGLLAQGHSPWDAACLGVFLHGLAADRLAAGRPYGFTASEVAMATSEVIGHIFNTREERTW